jgi:hypothetical protein
VQTGYGSLISALPNAPVYDWIGHHVYGGVPNLGQELIDNAEANCGDLFWNRFPNVLQRITEYDIDLAAVAYEYPALNQIQLHQQRAAEYAKFVQWFRVANVIGFVGSAHVYIGACATSTDTNVELWDVEVAALNSSRNCGCGGP